LRRRFDRCAANDGHFEPRPAGTVRFSTSNQFTITRGIAGAMPPAPIADTISYEPSRPSDVSGVAADYIVPLL
jgi:hypothetical protein